MNDPEQRRAIEASIRARATRRVRMRLGFYWHAAVFALSNTAMIAINYTYTPDRLWFVWPLCGWGAALALHGLAALQTTGLSEGMIEKEVQRELARRGLA
jgi:hypothetical protein